MLTRTSAPDCLRSGIHMNRVDTGWITDEHQAEHPLHKERDGFQPPLDGETQTGLPQLSRAGGEQCPQIRRKRCAATGHHEPAV